MRKFEFLLLLGLSFAVTATDAQSLADSLRNVLQTKGKDTTYAKALAKLAAEVANSNTDSALLYNHDAATLSQELNYSVGYAITLNNYAWIYYRKGDFFQAFKYALQGLRFCDSLQLKPQLAAAYKNMGAISNSQGKYKESLSYFRKELAINQQLNDENAIGACLNNIAFSNLRDGQLDSALYYGNMALAFNKKLDNQYLIAFTLRNLADVYVQKGAFQQAINYLEGSLAIARGLKNNFIIITDLYRLGKIYKQQKNYPKAIYYFEQTIVTGRAYGVKGEVEIAFENLSQIYAQQGDFKKAFEYQSKHVALHDSLNHEENKKQIEQLQAQFNSEKKEVEIAQLKKSAQQQRITNFLLGGIILLLLVLMFNFLQRYRFRKQANAKLEEQKQQLEQTSLLKDKIFSILSHDLRSPISALTGTLYLMDNKLLSAEEFETVKAQLGRQLGTVTATLDNLLLWSQNQMDGQSLPKKDELIAKAVVQESINLLSPVAAYKTIKIENQIPAYFRLMADKQHIDIVLRNLISNAIKFTPADGKITISAKTSGNQITICVTDTGVGMSTEQIQQLFHVKTHFTTYGTMNEKGTGLGLLLCKEFVEKNDGKLFVESEPGKGSSFCFTLPSV